MRSQNANAATATLRAERDQLPAEDPLGAGPGQIVPAAKEIPRGRIGLEKIDGRGRCRTARLGELHGDVMVDATVHESSRFCSRRTSCLIRRDTRSGTREGTSILSAEN